MALVYKRDRFSLERNTLLGKKEKAITRRMLRGKTASDLSGNASTGNRTY
jgi:hypothetical protein